MKKIKSRSATYFGERLRTGGGSPFLALAFVLIFLGGTARAEILIPIEELPSETVIPQLDAPLAVYDRVVTYANRFAASFGTDLILDEPFYQGQSLQLKVGYNWNETSGLYFNYQSWLGGVSRYAVDFSKLDFTKASGPSHGFGLEYQHRFLYGKICIARDLILPITMSWSAKAGEIAYGSRNLPYAGLGFSNIFYFNPSWGLDLDLDLMYRTIIDPLSHDIRTSQPTPSNSQFGTTSRINSSISLSVTHLF